MPKKEAQNVLKRDILGEKIESVIMENRGTSGTTGRIANAAKALNQGRVKAALMMTDREKLDREHLIVVSTAKKCVADKENCPTICKEGAQQLLARITTEYDDTDLEGLEDYMTEQKLPDETGTVKTPAAPSGFLAKAQKTDEELFEACEECHVAVAASRFADVCAEMPEEAGECEVIGKSLANENTEPADWLKAMVQTAEKAQGKAKQEMAGAITELTEYLERRNSPLLKAIDKEESHV